jgi:O-methyltransferase
VYRVQIWLHKSVARLSYGVTHYRHPFRMRSLKTATKILGMIPAGTTTLECVELLQAVGSLEKVAGDMAEAGVYRGATAALMLSASGKRLHLFDTFEGLPESENQFEKGEWTGSESDVRKNLGKWVERLEFHRGLFPASATGLEDLRFSFVHLDLDLYESTRAALEWFWPRLALGGAILSHDYPLSEGVVRAFHEFFDKRREPFIPLSGNQCLAIKISSDVSISRGD